MLHRSCSGRLLPCKALFCCGKCHKSMLRYSLFSFSLLCKRDVCWRMKFSLFFFSVKQGWSYSLVILSLGLLSSPIYTTIHRVSLKQLSHSVYIARVSTYHEIRIYSIDDNFHCRIRDNRNRKILFRLSTVSNTDSQLFHQWFYILIVRVL